MKIYLVSSVLISATEHAVAFDNTFAIIREFSHASHNIGSGQLSCFELWSLLNFHMVYRDQNKAFANLQAKKAPRNFVAELFE